MKGWVSDCCGETLCMDGGSSTYWRCTKCCLPCSAIESYNWYPIDSEVREFNEEDLHA